MAEVKVLLTDDVNGNSNEIYDLPIIQAGKIWVVKEFGGADKNIGDNKSSVIILYWGSEIVEFMTVTGNTFIYKDLNREFVGDGVKRLRIFRQNNSATVKPVGAWIKGYERR